MRRKVIIMGAAGRDFHNFNVVFRNNPRYHVVAFTAAQISGIAGRKYPPVLAGKLYPRGIPIYPEEQLTTLIKKHNIDTVVLAYSDLLHEEVMQKAAIVLAAGANFELLGPEATTIKSRKPVISICAVRTGVGKSEVTRYVADLLRKRGIKFAIIRHPMPYGILKNQIWERFETYDDLKKYNVTIEEREEYEPHIERKEVVYAGVDYGEILKRAEREAQVIIWDGGNNDFPFYKSDLQIVLADPLRVGHELRYYPGEANARMADVVIINKENTAKKKNIEIVRQNIKRINPRAKIIDGLSIITTKKPELMRGKRVLVIEDGPTLTHGGMAYGAGTIAAKRLGAKIIDPRRYAVGSIREVYKKFPQLGTLIPAMGYSPQQIKELQRTINATPSDAVIIGTPIRLERLIKMNKPSVRIDYNFKEDGAKLIRIINKFLRQKKLI